MNSGHTPVYKLLTATDDQLRSDFLAVTSLDDLARVLAYGRMQLLYWIRLDDLHRYREFVIPKRSGGVRALAAPVRQLRLIQQRLNQVLHAVYVPRASAHGFVRDRSVITNAREHVHRRVIVNVDLKDFFGTIHRRRVYGLFRAKPFGFSNRIAWMLMRLTCFGNSLPQGAPTSPIVSNMICYRLDRELTALAKHLGYFYTRYADDLTFSSPRKFVPPDLASHKETAEGASWSAGQGLEAIVSANGFQLNEKKTRVLRPWHCQEVTGVVVNSRLNVKREYIRAIGSKLFVWRKHGLNLNDIRALRGMIDYVGQVRGANDPLFLKHLRQWFTLWTRDGYPARKKPIALMRNASALEELQSSFRHIKTMSDRQQAGLEFERWLHRLFEFSGVRYSSGFRVTGEQIDGAFEYQSRHFLVEAKWYAGSVEAATCYAFEGKVRRKSSITLGLLISIGGFSRQCLDALANGSEHRIILVDKGHLERVLSGERTLGDVLDACIRGLAHQGKGYVEPNLV